MRVLPIVVAVTLGVAGGGAVGYRALSSSTDARTAAASVSVTSAAAVPAAGRATAAPSSTPPAPAVPGAAAPAEHAATPRPATAPAQGASGKGAPGKGAPATPPGAGRFRPHCTSSVSPSGDLEGAVARLRAGRTLCLTPGTYRIPGRIHVLPQGSGSPGAPAVIAARDGSGTVTVDGEGAEEVFYVAGAHDVVIQGLRITGGAYHGVKIDPPSTRITLRDNAIFDNFRAGDDQQYSGVKGCCLVSTVTIEGNDIYDTHPGPGSNQQGIDCNGCLGWVVRGNRVHGIRSQGEDGNAIQFKSGSTDTVIAGNVVYDNFIGISYGGFGTPAWGHQQHESVGGVVEDNVVFDNVDAGITAIDTVNGKVLHNTLWNNGFAPDVRRGAVNLQYADNILDRPLLLRDGTTARATRTYVLTAPAATNVFVDARHSDFRLRPHSPAAGRGARIR